MCVPSACCTPWLAAAPHDKPAGGERAEDFEVPQPGRGQNRAVVGHAFRMMLCTQDAVHQLTCRHKLWISALSQTCKNSNTYHKASFPQSPMQAHLYTYAQHLHREVMEWLRLEKTSSMIKSVPQPFVFFFPLLVLAAGFSNESVFLEGWWTGGVVITHVVVKLRNLSLGWVLFVLVVNKTWWMDKQLPQSLQSV